MGCKTMCKNIAMKLKSAMSYWLMLGLQFGSAGMYIITMDVLNKGMSHLVFIVYRNAIAAITLAPFALVLERKVRPKMTFRIFMEIFTLAFLEIILDQCFSLLGMKLTSASFTSAVMNSVPSITFVMAVILRLEPMKMKSIGCQAKVLGTAATFGGAILMALYKGPVVNFAGRSATVSGHPENVNDPTGKHWMMGTCFVLIGCAAFSAFYILQAVTLRKYPAEMSLSSWICFIGSLQSLGVAAYVERSPHSWSVGWDARLFASAYSGIVTSGIQYYVQGLVMKTKGPVFVTAFNPLRMIIVTALATFILSEQLHLGSIIGGGVVVVGLYLVAWGKSKEFGKKEPLPGAKDNKNSHLELTVTVTAPKPNDTEKNTTNDNDQSHDTEFVVIDTVDKSIDVNKQGDQMGSNGIPDSIQVGNHDLKMKSSAVQSMSTHNFVHNGNR